MEPKKKQGSGQTAEQVLVEPQKVPRVQTETGMVSTPNSQGRFSCWDRPRTENTATKIPPEVSQPNFHRSTKKKGAVNKLQHCQRRVGPQKAVLLGVSGTLGPCFPPASPRPLWDCGAPGAAGGLEGHHGSGKDSQQQPQPAESQPRSRETPPATFWLGGFVPWRKVCGKYVQ